MAFGWIPLGDGSVRVKIPASSVPFFSEECGETFCDVSSFDRALSAFLNRLSSFKPRKYVTEKLSMKGSEEKYTAQYFSALP
jgi:hypothetical protein